MKFLLDVHIAASIGRMLAELGHDVVSAAVAHAVWADKDLLELAVREHRVLVTEDRDFSDLIYRHGASPPPAILYLRCAPSEQPIILDRLRLLLANMTVDGHLVVVQRTSVRHRPLPGKSNDNG